MNREPKEIDDSCELENGSQEAEAFSSKVDEAAEVDRFEQEDW